MIEKIDRITDALLDHDLVVPITRTAPPLSFSRGRYELCLHSLLPILTAHNRGVTSTASTATASGISVSVTLHKVGGWYYDVAVQRGGRIAGVGFGGPEKDVD